MDMAVVSMEPSVYVILATQVQPAKSAPKILIFSKMILKVTFSYKFK